MATLARSRFVSATTRALRAPALGTAAALGLGGIGFALGSLLLARLLPPDEFGTVALLLALTQVGTAIGASGLPILIVRHEWTPHASLLRLAIATSAAAAALASSFAAVFYGMSVVLASVLGCMVLLAASSRVASAFFQSRQRWGTSLLLNQTHNWVLLGSAGVVWLVGEPYALTVAVVMSCSYLAAALMGWAGAVRYAAPRSRPPLAWGETGIAAAQAIATNAFFQIDRLLIGKLLTLEDIAIYAVVAAFAGSAFRMLQVAAGYTLAPRLRKCADRRSAQRVLRDDVLLLSAVSVFAAILLLTVCPWLFATFLAGYRIPDGLLFALVSIGFVRVWESLAASVVTALGSAQQMKLLSVCGWSALVIAATGASVGSHFSLTATVYGIGSGWLAYALSASILSWRVLR